jgi:hypothetical protein
MSIRATAFNNDLPSIERAGASERAKIVFAMDRSPQQPVQDPPNLIRSGPFSLDRLLSHVDPESAEESEAFVRLIQEQRDLDLASDRNGKAGR